MTLSVRQVAFAFLVLLVVAVMAAPSVGAHFSGNDAVDDCEIRYKDYTDYDVERQAAEAGWEGINGADNCVSLERDTAFTAADLKFEDVDWSSVTWAGLYVYTPIGVDSIYFNDHYMED